MGSVLREVYGVEGVEEFRFRLACKSPRREKELNGSGKIK